MHYVPVDGLYVYSRYNEKESVIVILNNNEKESRTVTRDRYPEVMKGFTSGYEVITGKRVEDLSSFTVAPKTAMIIELK
jgi:hypothetical protein